MTPERPVSRKLGAGLGLRVVFAQAALLWERVWVLAWPATGIVVLFLAVSLFDLWAHVPAAIHALGLAALAAGVTYGLAGNLLDFSLPARAAAMRRLEAAGGVAHRPFDALGDRLAAGVGDPLTEALWRAHAARAAEALGRVGTVIPHPGLAARDPRALRLLVILLFGAGLASAGADAPARLARALSPKLAVGHGPAVTLDAWIDPPAYTKLPPTFLSAGPITPARGLTSVGPVPAGAILTVRLQGLPGQPRFKVIPEGDGPTRKVALAPGSEGSFEGRLTLAEDATIELRSGITAYGRFRIKVTPDLPPEIAFADPVQTTARGTLRISYRTKDDFGVADVKLHVTRNDIAAASSEEFHEVGLPAPPASAGSPQGETKLHTNTDLTSHPWAGFPVMLTLIARDAAGQEGRSVPLPVVLPERHFTNPLAQALIEARKSLVRNPDAIDQPAQIINGVSQAIRDNEGAPGVYLALRAALWQVVLAHEQRHFGQPTGRPDSEALSSAIGLLWDIAVALEDGALGKARSTLDEAKRALSEALEKGASEEEIERHLAALREALARYLSAIAERMAEAAQSGRIMIDPNVRAVTPHDFAKMLDLLESLSRTGARDQAQDMLAALDDLLQNLATPDMLGKPSAAERAQEEIMRGLSDVIGKQRALMDDTFRAGKEASGEAGDPDADQSTDPDKGKALAARQEQLRRRLGEAMASIGEQTGEIPGAFGRAERAMNAAREALSQGKASAAVAQQKTALEALREGANAMAKAMAEGARAGGQGLGAMGSPSADPFGRPSAGAPDSGSSVKVPDVGEAQRAREILDEIRRRAAERGRPQDELDYLDRLLRRF